MEQVELSIKTVQFMKVNGKIILKTALVTILSWMVKLMLVIGTMMNNTAMENILILILPTKVNSIWVVKKVMVSKHLLKELNTQVLSRMTNSTEKEKFTNLMVESMQQRLMRANLFIHNSIYQKHHHLLNIAEHPAHSSLKEIIKSKRR